MPLFLISYDLKTVNDDNTAVRENLLALGAKPVLESVWTYTTQHNHLAVAEAISKTMKKGDKFVVAEVRGTNVLSAEAPFSSLQYFDEQVQTWLNLK